MSNRSANAATTMFGWLIAAAFLGPWAPAATAPGVYLSADRPPAMVPLGVYWPWERTEPLAKFCGLPTWVYVDKALGILSHHCVNTVWVVNFPISELAPMLRACQRHGVYLLAGFGEIHYDIPWRRGNWKYFGQQIKRIQAEVHRSGHAAEYLLGYILCDEPRPDVMDGIEHLRRLFADMDPRRPAFTVTTWSATPAAIQKTRQPVICTDLYPFFGPRDPNGPHTPAASRSYYTRNLTRFSEMLGGRGRALWAMFQCFAEIWGPWRYDDQFRQIALPGAYLHWVCPTPAQMRWQVWAALRSGARGFICFLALPQPPDPKSAQRPSPAVQWKEVLIKRPTVAGPAALLNPDLSPTDQLEAMGRAYRAVVRLGHVVLRWTAQRRRGRPPSAVAHFADPQTSRRYAVVVNDDFEKPAQISVPLGDEVASVTEALSGRRLQVVRVAAGRRVTVTLQPGDGCVLAMETHRRN